MWSNPLKSLFQYFYVAIQTAPRDIRGIYYALKLVFHVLVAKFRNDTVVTIFARHVIAHPKKVAFIQEGKSWTYEEVDHYSNAIGNLLMARGIKSGDEVALLMTACSEYPIVLMALAKIGAVAALINENLRHDALTHAVTCVNSKAIIFNTEYEQAVAEVKDKLSEKTEFQFYCYGPNKVGALNVKQDMLQYPQERLQTTHKGNFMDKLCYIYTSGTTGLPKAAIWRHQRYIAAVLARDIILSTKPNDVVYCAMPLYHTMGLSLGVGAVFVSGITAVLKQKFSASQFWSDCVKYDCTIIIYVGEVLRYLLAQPPKPTDKSHKVRVANGVGLRQQIWREFKERFNVKRVVELYASTEGNAILVNVNDKEGACGFLPAIFPRFVVRKLYPTTLVKVNEDGEPIRDGQTGQCEICEPDEYGMIIAKIQQNSAITRFDGYSDSKETQKKILKNVFESGDAYFASGDVLYMDDLSYLYFKDRTGDTFRWKGENVSTTEVEGLISKVTGITDVICYGVEIPNSEGKAGMVAIASTKEPDWSEFYQKIKVVLPKYAIPVFVRMIAHVELTGTFKYSKTKLKKEGFNINATSDKIFYLNNKGQKYEMLDSNTYDKIMSGHITF